MSALPGGDADKLGNRFEDWWTLYRLADVLNGSASRMRMEPPGPIGEGIEFWIDEAEGRSCEQAKDYASGGQWTVHRLIERKVLGSVQQHLAREQQVRLVLSTGAPDLSALTARARKAITPPEFADHTLTVELRLELARIAALWKTDEETTWTLLRRVQVEHHPPETLRRLLLLRYAGLVHGDPQDAVFWLRGWLTDQLQQELTGPLVWAALAKAGFRRALVPGDPAALAAVARTVERHRTRVSASLPAVTVPQPAEDELLDLLRDEHGPRVLVVHGRAGSGKSVVAGEVVHQLHQAGWYAAVVTMDDELVRTAAALGRASELPGSPVALLGGLAQGSPAVLLIDQLDAVSTYSGRMPDSFEAVAELLDEATAFRGLRVVLAVRTVDLKEDPRLRQLVVDGGRASSLAVPDLEPARVRQALIDAGHDPALLSVQTVDLLCVPLHLAVFSRLSRAAQNDQYASLTALYQQYTMEVRRRLEQQLGQLDWAGITSALVTAMSDRESLRVPRAVVGTAAVGQINALVSAGIVEREGQQLRFFHETYFDFLFAGAFVGSQRDLHSFLVGSGQQLFRRGQTRQVLDYLAGTDPIAFRHAVVQLLGSNQIRPHLQDVTATVLRQHQPNADDWLALEPLAFGPDPAVRRRLIPLLSTPGWFDAADASGRWPGYLADADRLAIVADQLVIAARDRGPQVSALVTPHIGTSTLWRDLLRAVVQWSTAPDTVDLAVTLMERGELDDVKGPIAVNADFFSIVYGLHTDDPAGAARLLGAYLRRGIARAAADGADDPFQGGHLRGSGREILQHIAQHAPRDYVEYIGHPLVQIIQATATAPADGKLRRSRHWAYRGLDDDAGLAAILFTATEQALRTLASTTPQLARDLAVLWTTCDVKELRYLACRTYLSLGDCGAAVAFLLSDENNLQLGYRDSARWASRELVEMAAVGCTETELTALTNRLLWYAPPFEKTAEAMRYRYRGRSEYDLLSAIPPGRRNAVVTRRLGELERKFPLAPPYPPHADTMASFRGSPIREDASPRLTDAQWRRAISQYAQPQTVPRNWDKGGTQELASQLGRRSAEEPERFAALALSLEADTPPAHFARVVEAVAGLVPISTLSRLCAHAHTAAGPAVLRAITEAIETAGEVDETLLALLELAATDEDPQPGEPHFDDLVTAGLNCTRGAAARVIAVLWFSGSEHVSRLLPTVTALAADPVPGVRAMAAEAVGALLRHQSAEALDLADCLLDGPDELLGASTIAALLGYCIVHDPSRFSGPLARALAGPEQPARAGGRIWAASLVRGRLTDSLPTDPSDLSAAARRGAADALATAPALALPTFLQFLDDDDGDVREAAADGMRGLDQLDEQQAEELLARAIGTRGFAEHADDAFRVLAHSERRLPDSALTACERAIEAIGPALGDIRTGISMAARDITTTVLRLYRQGDDDVRNRCLDLIDALTEIRAYGLDEQIDAVR